MPISKSRGLFGGTKLAFKCPTCGAKMRVTPGTRTAGDKLACTSCAKVHALSGADLAFLEELKK